MKKLCVSLLVLSFGTALAQQSTFGIKAGYASSKLKSGELENAFDDVNIENKSKSGYFVGAFIEYRVTDKFALQGELQYANLGGQLELKLDDGSLFGTFEDKINFNQILIPVSAKFYATPQLALYAGPSVGFNSGYKTKIKLKDTNVPAAVQTELTGNLSEVEKEQDSQLEENLKSTNFNVFFGGEYTFYKGIFLDARYTVGLTNYEKNPQNNSETKMNYLQVGLGYKF